ncbi:FadR/GntR family transcriptional regulator [Nocardia crassostreae]|uniref:FadR/GntR family transcriptional regulator n=1 Tax=Nocardia crassostreae TaxID=53428 RepID=UPI00082F5281|nr:FCD domain-containing protein [Nocardia crassostreae]
MIERLREQIVSGVWPVGSRIPPEKDLMGQLQVARGTLREAIRGLAHAGLLEVRQGDGTYVRATGELSGALRKIYSDKAFEHLIEVREALDLQAARMAAQRATEQDLASLDESLRRRAIAWRERNRDEWIEADWEFHTRVVAAHNPVLAELYRNFAEPLREAIEKFWDEPHYDGGAPQGHEDLLTALRRRDPAEAARQAAENLTDSLEWARQRTPRP